MMALATPFSEKQINDTSPLVLSFIGDGVQTLFVRTKFVRETHSKTNILHQKVSEVINATAQAKAFHRIEGTLNERESDIYRRCRNAKSNTVAKNASICDYRVATGVEGVIGYLYLTAQTERLEILLENLLPETVEIEKETQKV